MRTPIGENPFKLAYKNDVVIPAKVGITTFKVTHYQDEENEKQLRLILDLINKVRMDAEQKVARNKNLMTKPRQFNIKDLILKRVSLATKDPANGNWSQLGRTIQSHQLQKMKIVLPRSPRWMKARAFMEHRAPEEVLSVKTCQEGQHG